MNISPIKSALKPKNGFICLSCLLNPIYSRNWRQTRRYSPVYPTPDPSVATALYADHKDDIVKSAKKKKKKIHKPPNRPASYVHDGANDKVKQKPDGRTIPETKGSKNTETRLKVGDLDVLNANNRLAGQVMGSGESEPKLTKKNKKPRPNIDNGTKVEATESIKTDEQVHKNEVGMSELALVQSSLKKRRLRKTSSKSTAERLQEKIKQAQSADGLIRKTPDPDLRVPIRKFISDSLYDRVTKKILSKPSDSLPPEPLAQKLKQELAAHKASLIAKDKAVQPSKVSKHKSHWPHHTSVFTDTKDIESPTFDQAVGHISLETALSRSKKNGTSKTIQNAIEEIEAKALDISPLDVRQPPVPSLSYGLERVLFNPGVYHLQDPRSRVYNFDPYLQNIMPVSEFDFNALKEYITSSRDRSLEKIAQANGKRYVGSTSSMTGALAHFHFLLSQWRGIDTSMLSQGFPDKLRTFTLLQRCPSAIFLRWKDGTYAIDADKEFASANILSMLGKSMEKLLTLSTEDFERYRKRNHGQISDEERNAPESFHYSVMGDFLMRSQLDAYDPRLPGTGMFDLKTRAVVSIRMDAKNYEEGSGYEIKSRLGEWESFEREYFDMIRAAFLKYSLQVRMGRMDGIFVAFHNTERIFGFQYISLPEMDAALHGQSDTAVGDQEFRLSLELLNKVLDKATKKFPEKSLRIHFETRDAQTPFMYVFAEPVTEEQVQELQSRNDAKVEEFERDILGLDRDSGSSDDVEKEDNKWADIQAKVQEAMDKDERSMVEMDEGVQFESGITTIDRVANDEEFRGQSEGKNEETLGEDDYSLNATANGNINLENDEDGNEDEEEEEEDVVDQKETDGEQEEDDENDEEEEDNEEEGEEEIEEEQEGDGVEEKDESNIIDLKKVNLQQSLGDAGSTLQPSSNALKEVVEDSTSSGQDFIDEVDSSSVPTLEDNNDATTMESESPEAQTPNAPDTDKEHTQSVEAATQPPTPPSKDSETDADSQFLDQIDREQSSVKTPENPSDILAMTLTIRNKVNDRYILRPDKLAPEDSWSIEYSLVEVTKQSTAWSLYHACQLRRKKRLDSGEEQGEENAAASYYVQKLRNMSQGGRGWRREQDRMEEGSGKVVLGREDKDMNDGGSEGSRDDVSAS